MSAPKQSFGFDHGPEPLGPHFDLVGVPISFEVVVAGLVLFSIFLLGTQVNRQNWPVQGLAVLIIMISFTAIYQALATVQIGDPAIFTAFNEDQSFKISGVFRPAVLALGLTTFSSGFGLALLARKYRASFPRAKND